MEFQKLTEKRRSVRKFTDREKIRKQDIEDMLRAAQEAPSWKNSQTGRYRCILSEEIVNKFRGECLPEGNALKCENAALIVTSFVRDRSGFQRDGSPEDELGNGWGCYDLGLQAENLVLKAEELGYGSLIIGIRHEAAIRRFLSIPQEEIIVAVIAVGIPAEDPKRPKRKEISEIAEFY